MATISAPRQSVKSVRKSVVLFDSASVDHATFSLKNLDWHPTPRNRPLKDLRIEQAIERAEEDRRLDESYAAYEAALLICDPPAVVGYDSQDERDRLGGYLLTEKQYIASAMKFNTLEQEEVCKAGEAALDAGKQAEADKIYAKLTPLHRQFQQLMAHSEDLRKRERTSIYRSAIAVDLPTPEFMEAGEYIRPSVWDRQDYADGRDMSEREYEEHACEMEDIAARRREEFMNAMSNPCEETRYWVRSTSR